MKRQERSNDEEDRNQFHSGHCDFSGLCLPLFSAGLAPAAMADPACRDESDFLAGAAVYKQPRHLSRSAQLILYGINPHFGAMVGASRNR
jgi:hypothetical protein